MKNWINQLLDLTIVFSFDHSGFKGADTILWLATTHDYRNFYLNKSSKQEDESLWQYCESTFASIKGLLP